MKKDCNVESSYIISDIVIIIVANIMRKRIRKLFFRKEPLFERHRR